MARIGVLCDREFFHPFDQRVYKSALSLSQAGHNVEIVTPHPVTKTLHLEGLTVHGVSTGGPPGATALRMLRQALRGAYELFYCHELDPLLYNLVLRPLARRPVIWDCHEYLTQMKLELQGRLASNLTALGLELAGPGVDAIVTVDNRLARRLARYGPVTVLANYPRRADFLLEDDAPESHLNRLSAGRPSALGAGVSTPDRNPSSAPARPATPEGKLPLPDRRPSDPRASDPDGKTPATAREDPCLLFVGSLTRVRGARVLVEAFKLLRDQMEARLEVAGGFNDPALETWARTYDSDHGLDIRWHGWVDHRELTPLLARADLGLFLNQPSPRYLKGVPTKLFEYLLCGLPVLASSGPMIERLLARGPCGRTVDPTDPAAIARAMSGMLQDPRLPSMGQRGRELVWRDFTWETREARLVALVDRLLGGP